MIGPCPRAKFDVSNDNLPLTNTDMLYLQCFRLKKVVLGWVSCMPVWSGMVTQLKMTYVNYDCSSQTLGQVSMSNYIVHLLFECHHSTKYFVSYSHAC